MNVLITGGAGFIGSHIADLHVGLGDHVTVIDDLSTGQRANIVGHIENGVLEFHEGSLTNWDGLEEAVAAADKIYHMAAVVGVKHVLENPSDVISVNMTATGRLLKVMQERQSKAPVIIASSSEVYGFSEKRVFAEDDDLVLPSTDRLRWCYAVTKLADEMMAFSAHHQSGLKTVTVRLFNTVGPRQSHRYGMVLPHFVQEAVAGENITVYGDGLQTRSFCDVRDMARMLAALSEQEQAYGQIVNVGADREISINDLAALVADRSGTNSPIIHMDYREAYGIMFRDINHRRPDLSRLYGYIDYKPSHSLEDTIDTLIALYREN